MDLIVELYFNKSELNDDVKTLILNWVSFFKTNWKDLFNIDKEVILKLEFFLDNKKIISKNAPPNNEVYLHELKKNPEVVLKFMKVSLHLLLFRFLCLDKVTDDKTLPCDEKNNNNNNNNNDINSNNNNNNDNNNNNNNNDNKKSKKKKNINNIINNNNNIYCSNKYKMDLFSSKDEIDPLANEYFLINELKYDRYKESEIFRNFFFTNKVTIYLYNWNKVDKFESLKSEKVNQLICLRGSVLRVSPIQLLITNLNFLCDKCKCIIKVEFMDGKFEPPRKCINNNCDGKNFLPIRESAKSLEYQKIILKENRKIMNNIYETNDTNIKNLTVTLEASKFFVNSCIPGNYVEALGILKVISFNNSHLINGKNSLFNMYIDCLSIFPLSSKKYLNNNYFNVEKIKEIKNKIHTSFLWESYIDKVDNTMRNYKRNNNDYLKSGLRQAENIEHDNLHGDKIKKKTNIYLSSDKQNDNHQNVLNDNIIMINGEEEENGILPKKNCNLHKIDQLNNNIDIPLYINNKECVVPSYKYNKYYKDQNNDVLAFKSDDILFEDKDNFYDNVINMYGDYINEENDTNRNVHYINSSDEENENYHNENKNNITNNNINNNNNNNNNNNSFHLNNELDSKVLEFIQDMQKIGYNKFYLLISSFCPRIIMNSYIKAGLLLSLLGGKTIYDDNSQIKRRGNIHNLLIGDPGLGKSRILQYISNIMEKSLFICSTSTTINGLTACAVKDTSNNEYALEGGALVLSDKGVCCIDELDKISLNDQQSFLECMENQSINISKAGIVCNLKTRCTIIAASNPKEGKYNYKKSIFDNIKIPFPLLSRFDLVFLLADNISEEKDYHISNYLINPNKKKNDFSENEDTKHTHYKSGDNSNDSSYDSSQSDEDHHRNNEKKEKHGKKRKRDESSPYIFSIKDDLLYKCKQIDEQNYLPLELIGVYIKYCRKYIFPKLSEDAKKYVRKFYLHLRNLANTHNDISVPITIRQLESLIRLCQARARADLSNIVTLRHAKEVVEIYQKTIFYPLHLKTLNFKEKPTTKKNKGKSLAALSHVFKQKIIEQAKLKDNQIYNKELHNLARSIILSADSNVTDEALIHFVNNEGFILYKGGYWQVDSFYLK
ncbi:DNA helicase MCM8, putative [Plasmodium sp. gorilla clade G2]|uniref:DNA helicase MCM8, putative n=1 Tax=Plasmodium sp. gorilla clade G2 TaxID=880535 RepID=UPI000D21DA8F|nr:DNA helicase MCM8, putative [Plasmodium sp. gorilla clade G2]SOV16653.1 DNA helicase MCM8, putative [Plasmodium sp. gorilla clade G2]